jgi:excinuclease UvrABC helicase subunit UvrB
METRIHPTPFVNGSPRCKAGRAANKSDGISNQKNGPAPIRFIGEYLAQLLEFVHATDPAVNPMKDVAQWRNIQYLVEHGFRFYSAYEPSECEEAKAVKYPSTLEDANIFV